MERGSNPMQPMCRSGCGFYGNPATDGLCSVCYKDSLRKKQQHPVNPTSLSVQSLQTAPTFVPNISVTNTAQPTVQRLQHNENKEKRVEEITTDGNTAEGSSTSINNHRDDKEGDFEAKSKSNRCAMCRKKVGLTGFECRCGSLYCAVHRYSDKHNCTFDYREHGAQEIRRNNPVVVGEKIQKI
uniref:Putative an1-type zinc finger protein 6-like isoform x2 n=1 Tax=Tabanus bromius TaxID=304241 RepID=A0A0K8TPX9_TABBR